MKRIIFTLICALALTNVSAQTAKQILDKAASVVNAKKGATANFVMSGKYGKCLRYDFHQRQQIRGQHPASQDVV